MISNSDQVSPSSCPWSDSTPRALSSDPRPSSADNADQFDAAPNGAKGSTFFAAIRQTESGQFRSAWVVAAVF